MMFKEIEGWSPDRELQLLEDLAEAEADAFDVEIELPVRLAAGEAEKPWVAYWQLPPNGLGAIPRIQTRLSRGR